jgi:hypothetical protein
MHVGVSCDTSSITPHCLLEASLIRLSMCNALKQPQSLSLQTPTLQLFLSSIPQTQQKQHHQLLLLLKKQPNYSPSILLRTIHNSSWLLKLG